MILRPEYIERLKKLEDLKFNNFLIKDKNIHHIGNYARGNLYENITRIDFIALYPSILIGLFNEGLLNEKWVNDIDRVKWFLKNRKELKLLPSGEYEKWKIHCNSLYEKIKSSYVVEYVDMFYTDLIEKYGDLIIYNDVDSLYLKIDKVSFESKEWITELKDFKYDIQFINYLYLEDKKKYIEQEESGNINTKGFRDENKKQNLLNIIKREVRRRKLGKLGI